MAYYSILFETAEDRFSEEDNRMPEFFKDLHLDQIIGEIIADKEEYDLDVFFYHSLKSISAVNYRYEVMRDLENEDLFQHLTDFTVDMRMIREYLHFSSCLHHDHQKMK